MSDATGPGPSAPRSRIGPVVTIAIIAFIVGLGLMAYAVRNSPGFFIRTKPAPASGGAPAPAPSPTAAITDATTLALREAALAAQIANLEARTARTDADSAVAAGRAGRAEAILVAFAARRAIDRGVGLGYLEAQLRERFGPTLPNDVNVVIRNARAPVTIEDLREGLNVAAPTLLNTRTDWWAGIGSELRNLVVVHKAGTPSPLPSDRIARARRLIEQGNVEAALAEVKRLPGAGEAANWTAAAQRWVDTRRALDTLEAAAITGAIAPRAVSPVTVSPAPGAPPVAPADAGNEALF